MLCVNHLLRYLLIPYTDVGWSRTPLHSCKSTNQMFKVKQSKTPLLSVQMSWRSSPSRSPATPAVHFLPRCHSNPTHYDAQTRNIHQPTLVVVILQDCLAWNLHLNIWPGSFDVDQPTNHPRLPGVESTLLNIWPFDVDLGVHCSRVNKLLGDISCRQCLKIEIVKVVSQLFLTLSLASKMSKNIASGIFPFMKPIWKWWKVESGRHHNWIPRWTLVDMLSAFGIRSKT